MRPLQQGGQKVGKDYNAYIDQYKRDHYDRINILLPKGSREILREIAKRDYGGSVSALVVDSIERTQGVKIKV